MLLGQVAGKVWATKKSPALTGQAFLTVRVGERILVCADCVGAGEGETVLTITAPENVAGITARILEGETALEYDGMRVETGPLDGSGMSPVDAVPVLLDYAEGGYIAACGMETVDEREVLRVDCREPEAAAGEGRACSLWFDPSTHALLRGELSQDGFTVIQCEFSNFQTQ